jgi:hypothetical protein
VAHNVRALDDGAARDWQERLEQGAFPILFGSPLASPPESPPLKDLDLQRDVIDIVQAGPELLKQRLEQCAQLIRWNQAVSTPCGYYLFHGVQAQSKLLQSCCQRMTHFEPDYRFDLPFFRCLADNASLDNGTEDSEQPQDDTPDLVDKSTRTWMGLDQALGVVAGTSPLSLRGARNPLVLMDRWLNGTVELALSVPRGGDLEAAASPKRQGSFIGSVAMSRAAGALASLLYLHRLAPPAEALPEEGALLAQLPASVADLHARVAPEKPAEIRIRTALAAIDLAGFTPLHPRFARLRQGLRWTDLHPGHRLEQLVDVINETGDTLESHEAADYFKFTSVQCQRLGWPEVPRFLDNVNHGRWQATDHPIEVMFRRASNVRETNPACFWDPVVAAQSLQECPSLDLQLAPFLESIRADAALQLALDAELYAMGFQLFFGTHEPHYVCPPLATVVEQLYSPTELLHHFFGLSF